MCKTPLRLLFNQSASELKAFLTSHLHLYLALRPPVVSKRAGGGEDRETERKTVILNSGMNVHFHMLGLQECVQMHVGIGIGTGKWTELVENGKGKTS